MSESKEQFKITGSKTDLEEPSSVATPPPNLVAPVAREVDLQRIDINRIKGPLVVFFGPSNIGKTVTLLRLCSYLRGKYEISPDQSFRTDDLYAATTAAFESMLQSMRFAPDATGDVNFLLLNVMHNGIRFCQFLESPGEHFFDRTKPNAAYPTYMNKILADGYMKLFVFFFEIDMFRSDDDLRNYSDKISRLVSDRISSERDRVIILCNKCDLQSHFRGGKPIVSEYRKAICDDSAFRRLEEALRNSGFRHVPFVAFSSGSYNNDSTGQKAFAPSPEHYPKALWSHIYQSIHGRPWWKFW